MAIPEAAGQKSPTPNPFVAYLELSHSPVRTLLLYNPVSGRQVRERPATIQAVCDLLAQDGHHVTAESTTAPGSAAGQTRNAIAEGFTHILACGGDGTVHDVLQGMVDPRCSSSADRPILGVIPMGSANALARHLHLSMDPRSAARQLLAFQPRTIPVGRIDCSERVRYFTVMAGCGPDGALVYKMLSGKHHIGRLAYYIRAAALFARHRFEPFDLAWTEADFGTQRQVRAVGTMAVRIDDLGGLFSRLSPAAAVHHPHLHLVAVREPGWLSLPAWFGTSWVGVSRWNPLLETVHATEFTCTPLADTRVHVQADGEWIGTAPAHVSIIPNAVRLLMPPEGAAVQEPSH